MRRSAYHHGNLREAVLEAARDLIAQKSPEGFTFAEAAKMAGVSVAAPYRHFKSKDDVVRALAELGFQNLLHEIHEARTKKRAPIDALIAMGEAYLSFAQSHKGEYMAMFETALDYQKDPVISQYFQKLIDEIGMAVEDYIAPMPPLTRPPVKLVAQHFLASAHGVVEIFARSAFGRATVFSPSDILESQLRIYLAGLRAQSE